MVAARLLSTWQPARLVVLDCQPASLMEKSHTLCGSFFIFCLGLGVNRVTDSQPSPIAFLLSHRALGHTRATPSPRTSANARRDSPVVRPNKLQRLVTPFAVTSKPLATQAKISFFIPPAAYESPCVPVRLVVHASSMNSTLAYPGRPSARLAPGDNAPARSAKHRQQNERLRLFALLAPRFNPYQIRSKTLCLATDGTQRSIGASGFDVPIAVDSC